MIQIQQKARLDTLHPKCIFASGEIYGSCSALWCVCGAKRDRTIFHARVGLIRIRQECARRCYPEHVIFNPVEFAGHVVHSGASGARNVIALIFMLTWDRYGFNKKCVGTRYAELVCFQSGGIHGSCSAFGCVQGAKC
jgi:hypothetical protein